MSSEPAAKKQKIYSKKPHAMYKFTRKQFLEVGQRGFLATCNFREKDCVRESYNILNQYADELYGPQGRVVDAGVIEKDNAKADTSGDISDQLQMEISAAKQKGKDTPKPRFQVVETGTTNCLFIRTILPDPVELGTTIVKDIAHTHEQKSRYLLRLVPIETVCRANLPDILTAGGSLFDKHFLKQSCTFAIVFNKRYNNDLKRDEIIKELASLVQSKNVNNSVDLKQAAKTVIVEIIKGLCCLSVVEGYLQYKKYNLVELANTKVETADTETNNSTTAAGSELSQEANELQTEIVDSNAEEEKADNRHTTKDEKKDGDKIE